VRRARCLVLALLKTNLPTPVVNQAGGPPVNQRESPPVRVRLRRINANRVKAYPPDGESKAWWRRLKKALGTKSSDFVNTSLFQLQAAAQLPGSGISEVTFVLRPGFETSGWAYSGGQL
jgi:hypothetical protein